MGQGTYKVELDQLQDVVKKLNGVLKDMQVSRGRAESGTYLPAGALGKNFGEEAELRGKHDEMKQFIETNVLKQLEGLIDDLRGNTQKAHGAYQDSEQETKNAMSLGGGDGSGDSGSSGGSSSSKNKLL